MFLFFVLSCKIELIIILASVAYISTQFLMETSLSQDVNRFDFNIPIEAFSHQYSSSPANVSPKDEGINEEENSETPSPLDEVCDVMMYNT